MPRARRGWISPGGSASSRAQHRDSGRANTRAFGFTHLIEIEDATGRVVAHVSPNPRVWEGGAKCWRPETREIVA